MVVSEKGLLRAMKDAYKADGYTVAVDDGGGIEDLILHTQAWTVTIEKNEVPGKILGLITEHLRKLPQPGEAFRVKKKETQTEIYGAVDSRDYFQMLWDAYPEARRGRKAEAKEAYAFCIQDDGSGRQALEALKMWKQSEQWAKDSGQYVPYLVNWISRGTWKTQPSKMAVPMGASGQLGQAELEAIQRVLAHPLDYDDGGQDEL